jgi:hypothetical protein
MIKYWIIFFIVQKLSPDILVLHNSGNVCKEFKRSAQGSVFYLISKKLLSKLSALVFYSNKNVVRHTYCRYNTVECFLRFLSESGESLQQILQGVLGSHDSAQ